MKRLTTILTFLVLSSISHAQQIQANAPIEPDDLGAYKWVLTATADSDSVVIFRVTTIRDWNNKQTTRIYDSICYDPDNQQRDKAFFINPMYFEPSETEEPTWHWCVFGGSGSIQGEWTGSSSAADKASITFESPKWGKTTKIMEVFVKSYAEVKSEYPKLPDITPNGGWRWAASKSL